ncbi:MAG: DUF1302 family protein [Oceanococcaceae bacterium]
MHHSVNTYAAMVLAAGMTFPASALQFEIGDLFGSVISFVTVGADFRMEDRDTDLIAKSNLFPGLCTPTDWTTSNGFSATEAPTYLSATGDQIGSTCNGTQDPDLNRRYVEAPGSFNINGDNGNMNFDRYDVVSAAAKLNTKLDMSWRGFNLFARGIWFFNDTLTDFDETRFDTSLQPRSLALPKRTEEQFGTDFLLQDAYISTFIPIGERELAVRIGRQGLNWGESTALPLNSINTINPPDQRLQRTPGFDLGELFLPVAMATVSTNLSLNLSVEAFYQFEWRPAQIDAPGTFYSTSDIFGGTDEDGYYAMLSFGKAPEDPFGIYASQDNSPGIPLDGQGDPFALGSASSRTIYRLEDNTPRDTGQYGFALRYFAENFNNGTEFAFYFANYHNRIPSASFIAAQKSCAGDATNVLTLALNCGIGQGDIGTLRLAEEPLPVDTAGVFVDYAEDIQMYGISFNTTIGDYALSGEYSFRPNMPIQIHSVDLTFAALQPAFPANSVNLTDVNLLTDLGALNPGILAGLQDALTPLLEAAGRDQIVLPGRRIAVPDYVNTIYRNNPYDSSQDGGYLIRGYERLPLGQLTTTLLATLGGDNLLRASQILMVGEFGLTHVLDFPDLDQLQFQGAFTETHASSGADGTTNGLADSAALTGATNTGGNGDEECERRAFDSDRFGTYEAEPCRQNPTAQDPRNFGDEISYGVRFLSLITYNDALFGMNVSPLIGLFYDIEGIAPGVGQNFVEGNFTGIFGVNFDYLARYSGGIRYTMNKGKYNERRDRDTLGLFLRYEF